MDSQTRARLACLAAVLCIGTTFAGERDVAEFLLKKAGKAFRSVDGKRITGFVNGKKIWSTSGAVRSPDGYVGCWVQEQSVEIRKVELIEK